MQHNFSSTEWASRAHSFVRDGVWPFVYDSVASACEAYRQCVEAQDHYRVRPGKTYDIVALGQLAFHINALASRLADRRMRECGALGEIAMRWREEGILIRRRKCKLFTLRNNNAVAVYRRLGTSDARALCMRWVSPFPPVVDATSMAGGLELFTDEARAERAKLPMIEGTREPAMLVVDVDLRSPLGAIAHACIERGDKSVNVSIPCGLHADLAPPVVVRPYGDPIAFVRRPYDECPTDTVIDAAGCIISRQEFERRRDKLNEEAALRRTLWGQAVMLTQGVKRVVKEFVKAVKK